LPFFFKKPPLFWSCSGPAHRGPGGPGGGGNEGAISGPSPVAPEDIGTAPETAGDAVPIPGPEIPDSDEPAHPAWSSATGEPVREGANVETRNITVNKTGTKAIGFMTAMLTPAINILQGLFYSFDAMYIL